MKSNIKDYIDFDLSIIPLKKKNKSPLIKWDKYKHQRATIQEVSNWQAQFGELNWGIVTGAISGIVVIDIDDMEQYEDSGLSFPDTVTALTSKGLHFYYKHPGLTIKNDVKQLEAWLDVRGDGGYVVAPPSTHPNGTVYSWMPGKSPWEHSFTDLPNWLLKRLTSKNSPSPSKQYSNNENEKADWGKLLTNGIAEGSRNDNAAKLAGHYFGLGRSREEVEAILTGWNLNNVPPLSSDELKSVIDSIHKRELQKPGKTYVMDTPFIKSFLNEQGDEIYERGSYKHTVLAEIIIKELPLYRNGRNFYYYDEKDGLWKTGAEDKIKLLIAKKLSIHANNSRVSEAFNHVVRITPVSSGDLPFEKEHPYQINLENGILNLQTGEFSPTFRPEYFQRIKVPIKYDPNATSEEVEKFLSSVLYQEDIEFIHQLAASILAKKMITPALIFFLGSGGNGKSKLLRLLSMLAGPQNTANIPLETLQNDRFASAELYMKLFNYCGDIGDGYLAQSDVLKTATGGDPLYAQYKGKDPFTFISMAVQAYSANNEPRFRDMSQGMRDRIYPVRMDRVFRGTTNEIVDPLSSIDDYQLSGWLNKLVLVFQDLMKNQGRYSTSEGMLKKREEWFDSMDLVAQFVNEECLLGTNDTTADLVVSKRDLWEAFNNFLTYNGHSARFTKNTFEKQIKRLPGVTEAKKRLGTPNPVHCFVGIKPQSCSTTLAIF